MTFQKILLFLLFLDIFRIQDILSFLLFLDIFCIKKCLETVKQQNPLKYSKNLVNSPVSMHSLLGKVRRSEGWNIGRLECWNVGRSEGWKVKVMKGFCPFPKS